MRIARVGVEGLCVLRLELLLFDQSGAARTETVGGTVLGRDAGGFVFGAAESTVYLGAKKLSGESAEKCARSEQIVRIQHCGVWEG